MSATTRPRGWVHSVVATLAALVWLSFASTLLDSPYFLIVQTPATAPVPEAAKKNTSSVHVKVVDRSNNSVAGATVHVFAMIDDQAYLAGTQITDDAGKVVITRVPRGEVWVLVDAPGKARATYKLKLGEKPGAVKIKLHDAHRLEVVVRDDDNRALENAKVTIRTGDLLPFVIFTGADGVALFDRLGPSPYTASASAPGHEDASRNGVTSEHLELTLRALGSFDVSVVHKDGSPAADSTVMLVGPGLWPARQATTDEAGHVLIRGLFAGAYDLLAYQGHFISDPSLATVLKRKATVTVKLELQEGRMINVKVVDSPDEHANPVAGANIVLAESGLSSFPREAISLGDGTATLGPISLRQASLSARAEGFVPRFGFPIPPDAPSPVIVPLVHGGAIEGDVVDGHERPVEGATIEVVGTDYSGMPVDVAPERIAFQALHFASVLEGPAPLIPAGELGVMPGPIPRIPGLGSGLNSESVGAKEPWVTHDDGRFRAAPIPPGRMRVLVRHPSYVEAFSEAVNVHAGEDSTVHVVLYEGGRLEGRVMDSHDRPLSGYRVEVAALHSTLVRSTYTASDATFQFSNLPPEVLVSAFRPENPDLIVARQAVEIPERGARQVTLVVPEPRDAVVFQITDSRKTPLDAVEITAVSLTHDSPMRTTLFTRNDGKAILPDAAGLHLRLELTSPGFATLVKNIPKADREYTIVLHEGTAARGEISSRRSRVAGADVIVISGGRTRRAKTDESGAFEFGDLPPGRARLIVRAKGYGTVDTVIQLPEADKQGRPFTLDTIELVEAGSVEGYVVDKDLNPVPGARVAVGAVPAFLPIGATPHGVAITNAEGHFVLNDVAEGSEIVLDAFAPGVGRGSDNTIRVRAGRTSEGIRIVLNVAVSDEEPTATGGVAVTLEEFAERSIRLRSVAEGSEAERADLLPGDVILSIDEKRPRSLEHARRLLSGPVGQEVLIQFRRAGEDQLVRFPRERVRR